MPEYKWRVWDDGLTEAEANSIKAWREKLNGSSYEFRVTPSEFHTAGYFQVEGRLRAGHVP